MIMRKAGNNICSTCYQFNMWYKGGGMFCCGVEGEELDEAEADDSVVVHPIEPNYEKDGTNDDNEEDADADGYTKHKRASLQIIAKANVGAAAAAATAADDDDDSKDNNVIGVVVDDDDNNNNDNDTVEKPEKDEAFYQRKERVLKQATLLAKLQKHIKKARSMRKLAYLLVCLGKVCTIDNVKASKMRVVITVDFCQNI